MTYTPEETVLAETLQRFQDAHDWLGTPAPMGPSLSNLNRAKYLIEHGYVHRDWVEDAA